MFPEPPTTPPYQVRTGGLENVTPPRSGTSPHDATSWVARSGRCSIDKHNPNIVIPMQGIFPEVNCPRTSARDATPHTITVLQQMLPTEKLNSNYYGKLSPLDQAHTSQMVLRHILFIVSTSYYTDTTYSYVDTLSTPAFHQMIDNAYGMKMKAEEISIPAQQLKAARSAATAADIMPSINEYINYHQSELLCSYYMYSFIRHTYILNLEYIDSVGYMTVPEMGMAASITADTPDTLKTNLAAVINGLDCGAQAQLAQLIPDVLYYDDNLLATGIVTPPTPETNCEPEILPTLVTTPPPTSTAGAPPRKRKRTRQANNSDGGSGTPSKRPKLERQDAGLDAVKVQPRALRPIQNR